MDVAEMQDIVIVGGGICGLATALALHRKGMRSIVLERAETLRATGAAIGIQSNGWRALDQLGVGTALRQTAIPIAWLRDVSVDNTSGKETSVKETSFGGEARCLKRSILLETLAKHLPVATIRYGCHIVSVQTDPTTSNPVLQLHDGSVIKARVVIGCDGVNSVIANFVGLKPPNQSPITNVRAFTNYPNGHGLKNEFITMTKDNFLLGRIPIDEKLVYWFVARKQTPQDSTISSKDAEKIIRSTLESVKEFPPEMIEMIEKSDVDSVTLNGTRYRAPWELVNPSFRKGTVTVAGDAMHVMGPFLGQGGSIALEDAVVLARNLARAHHQSKNTTTAANKRMELAIDQYVRERRMRLVQISTKTYTLGSLLETPYVFVKIVCIIVMIVFYRDRFGHARFDCGRL